MSKKDYGYIHFPASELKYILEDRQEALNRIVDQYANKQPAKGKAHCSVNISIVRSFVTEPKKDKDWIELIAFLAIRSILGKKKFIKTNHKHILSRMLGLNSYNEITSIQLSPEQLKLIDKYTKEGTVKRDICKQKMRRLLNRLELDWRLITYSFHIRGLYVSVDGKCTIEELAKVCEMKKESYRIKELQMQKREAYLNAKNTNLNRYRNDDFEQ